MNQCAHYLQADLLPTVVDAATKVLDVLEGLPFAKPAAVAIKHVLGAIKDVHTNKASCSCMSC